MNMNLRSYGKTLSVATLLVGALALSGCAHRVSGAQVGTGVGAVAGGVIGNAAFGGPVGTIGGAAAGALIGNQIGRNNDDYNRRGYRY